MKVVATSGVVTHRFYCIPTKVKPLSEVYQELTDGSNINLLIPVLKKLAYYSMLFFLECLTLQGISEKMAYLNKATSAKSMLATLNQVYIHYYSVP